MDKHQIAHDLAVARMAGKQLPAEELVNEYLSSYDQILEYLNATYKAEVVIKTFKGGL